MGFNHGTDTVDSDIKPPRNFAICRLELLGVRCGSIQFGRQPRPVAAQGVQLGNKLLFAVIGFTAPLHGGLQRVKRLSQTPRRSLDRTWIGHDPVLVGWNLAVNENSFAARP